jgi:hypothetical protein
MAAGRDFDSPQAEGGGSYQSSIPKIFARSSAGIVLHLGVLDYPYANPATQKKVAQAKKGKANKPIKPKTQSGMQTTGDVAEILEAKYGIMDTFAFMRLPDIAKELENSIAGELESLMMGGSGSSNPFKSAESAIESMFKNFLSKGDIEHAGIKGVPTQAAMKGVNHRLAHPYAKSNPRRESFIDTGTYAASFKAWIA